MLETDDLIQWLLAGIGTLTTILASITIYILKDFKYKVEKKNEEISINQNSQKVVLAEVQKDIHNIFKSHDELRTMAVRNREDTNDLLVRVSVLETWKNGKLRNE